MSALITHYCAYQQWPSCSEKIVLGLNLLPRPDTTHYNNYSITHWRWCETPTTSMWKYHRGVLLWHAHCSCLRCDIKQTEQAALQTCDGCEGFMWLWLRACVVVRWGAVRMGPAYRTAATPERDGGEPWGRSRRIAAAEIHHIGQNQAGALNCSLTTPKATSTPCYYVLLSIITWLIIWVWHAMTC